MQENNTNESNNEKNIANKKEQEIQKENNKNGDINTNKNDNNSNSSFFNKSLNAMNLAGRAASGVNNSLNNMANNGLDTSDKMTNPNETQEALRQMGNKSANAIANGASLARGIGNKLEQKKNNDKDKLDNKNKLDNKKEKSEGKGSDKKSSNNKKKSISNKLKNIAGNTKDKAKDKLKAGLAKAFMALPIHIKVIILGVGVILLLVILFLVLFIILTGGGSVAYGSSRCVADDFDISDLENTSTFTYTGVFDWKWQSPVKDFYEEYETYIDEDGFLRSGDDYIIALGTYFGTEKGTRYLITLENGTSFTAILGDTKSDAHTDETHRFHAIDGSVIEFEMGCGTVIDPIDYGFKFSGKEPVACSNEQSKIYSVFSGNIKSIQSLQDECNFTGQFIYPTPKMGITSCFGWRNVGGGASDYHEGIDIAYFGCHGDDIYAAASGTVIETYHNYANTFPECSNNCGAGVRIKHDDDYTTLYCHMNSVDVRVGDVVTQGQVIGTLGNSGCSTGSHLHYGIYQNGNALNPKEFLDIGGLCN